MMRLRRPALLALLALAAAPAAGAELLPVSTMGAAAGGSSPWRPA
jgi:hypothetical protein